MNVSKPSDTTQSPGEWITAMLNARLDSLACAFLFDAISEINSGVSTHRFSELFSMCNRHARGRIALRPNAEELKQAECLLKVCNPERWNLLEAMRISLLLAWPDKASFDKVYEHCFRFADEGETCALYRALPLLDENKSAEKRFLARATEGCRSNMQNSFEAVACDSNYPFLHFDTLSWHQLIVKAIFIGAPLWRVHGLDKRLSSELARMVLDLVDERRSAGRGIPPQLWLCFGNNANEDALALMQEELASCIEEASAKALIFALARAGKLDVAKQLVDKRDAELVTTIQLAEQGNTGQSFFAQL